MKENHDHKDNTGMIIAVVIVLLLVVGLIAYFVMNNKDASDVVDDTKDTIENVTDNNEKTIGDVVGSYQASINNDNGEDVAEDSEDFIELVLKEDGTYRLVMTSIGKDEITGSFTLSNDQITLTSESTNNNKENDNTNNQTNNNIKDTNTPKVYQFTINSDDTITYTSGNTNVNLAKVDNDSLRYIK